MFAGFEDEGKGQEPRNVGSPEKLEKEKKQIFCQSLQKARSLTAPRIQPSETYFRLLASNTVGE